MKEKSSDRQSCGGKLLEGLEQVGDRSDSCSEVILGNCVENGGHTSSVCPGAQPEFSLALSVTTIAWPRKPL